MSIKALQDYTYVSKYARYNKAQKRRETWNEACDRVMSMHLRRYPQAAPEIEWAFEQVRQKRVLGSQRALQFGGPAIETKHSRLYNCTSSYCDRERFFQECFWLLLCGCGTGFSVQKHHIEKLPPLAGSLTKGRKTYVVPDTIEGWADALGVLVGSYLAGDSEWSGHQVDFDYSLIRPAGSLLSSGSGKAPGPEPLRRSLDVIRKLLDRCLEVGQYRLRPIDAYDIVCHASDAVLAGGVRRSATICIFSVDDEEMISAKTGNWFTDNPQRGRSNNSAMLLRGKTSREDFNRLMSSVREFGEPGFVWSDSTERLFNPCVEADFYPVLENVLASGETELISGWQFCNLCDINGKKCKTKKDFAQAAKAASIIGTLQAGYTDFAYLGPVTEAIVRREALLGVSITGMMENPSVLFDPDTQREVAGIVVETNEEIAALLGINAAARTTCIKPSGTTSCILGSSSGVHPHHSKRYFRRTQGNALEAPLQHFESVNPMAVENSVWSANKTDKVITFCCEVPEGARTKVDVSALELLGMVKLTQQNWVAAGRVESRCVKPWLSHNVSNTINVKPDEWKAVGNYIFDNQQWFSGVSLLPQSGDLDYPQAPFTNVSTPKEILARYGDGALMASGLIVDGLRAYNGNLWAACSDALRPELLPFQLTFDKADWVRRTKQFATRYCHGDVRECTYLLKEVNNWKLWVDLKREYKDVDYSMVIEDEDNTKPQEAMACAGGACELRF